MTCNTPHGTILVVDDDVDIRVCAKVFLERAGYSVVTATDGDEGLRYYETHQSRILLLLTDVMMPKIDGLELADRVLGIDSKLPVLFMSGGAWSPFRGLECVAKPFRSAELVERVSRVLNRNPHSKGTAPSAQPLAALSSRSRGMRPGRRGRARI
jgi:two-component system cell cycle sensor histidine kinase/response regulator CckA